MAGVDILLATYNGSRYLPELLASLAAQTHDDWRLILRDDGSSDDSVAIVEAWAEAGGHAVEIIRDDMGGLGASGSFGRLLAASDAPYFMFCDQDDVWLPHKITVMLAETRRGEAEHGTGFPVLTHSDLRVVDAALVETAASFWSLQRFRNCAIHRGSDARDSLLVQNIVTGCATLGNAALRTAALPIPDDAIMHDWWIALVAAHLGEIRAVEEPTILYRQHGSNTIGARGWGALSVAGRVIREPLGAVRRTRDWLASSRKQTAAFVTRFRGRIDDETLASFAAYADLPKRGFLTRKSFLFRHGIWPQSRVRAAIMLLII